MYKCSFPGCDYHTESRSQIVKHHIVPRSKGGSNKKNNLLTLCPTHHSFIYIEGMKSGIHSKYTDKSIIIESRLGSTGGPCIQYRNVNDTKSKFHFI
jgi:hypothetical protein